MCWLVLVDCCSVSDVGCRLSSVVAGGLLSNVCWLFVLVFAMFWS